MDNQALDDFLTAAVTEYQLITPRTPLPCFALLLGHAARATDGRCSSPTAISPWPSSSTA